MKKLEFEGKIITPLIIGGVDHKPKLSVNSIRGALRWWVRAQCHSVEMAREYEEAIFGSTERASSVKIQFIGIKPQQKSLVNEYTRPGCKIEEWRHPLFYFNYNVKNRLAFDIEQSFKLRVIYLRGDDQYLDVLLNSFKLLSIFGGLGGRSRRGYGSVQFKLISDPNHEFNEYLNFSEPRKYFQYIEEFLSKYRTGIFHSSHCVLSNAVIGMDVGCTDQGYDLFDSALKKVIAYMVEVRSLYKRVDNGYHDNIKPHMENFLNDQPITIANPLRLENLEFGYPFTYNSKSLSCKKEGKVVSAIIKSEDRFASPVLVHIALIGEKYYPQVIYFQTNHIIDLPITIRFSVKSRTPRFKRSEDTKSILTYTPSGDISQAVFNFINKFSLRS